MGGRACVGRARALLGPRRWWPSPAAPPAPALPPTPRPPATALCLLRRQWGNQVNYVFYQVYATQVHNRGGWHVRTNARCARGQP